MHEEGVFVCLLLGVCRARAIADRSRQADWNDGTVRVVGGSGVCEGGDRFATRAFRLCCYRLFLSDSPSVCLSATNVVVSYGP